jgi:modulator of FtsH protease
MNQPLQTEFPGYPGGVTSVEQRNRVLRNTYWLLALSMVPTVLGAWIGITTGFTRSMGPGMSAMVFLIGAFGFIFAIEKTKNSAAGVPMLLGFTFFMGLMLSRLIGMVLGMNNGAGVVMTAFAGTGMIFFGMAAVSSVIKRDLSAMGKFLFVGVIMLIVAGIANILTSSACAMAKRPTTSAPH